MNDVPARTQSQNDDIVMLKALADDTLKINFVASFRSNVGAWLGLLVWDAQGNVIVAATKFTKSKLFSKEVEVVAFKWASLMSIELSLSEVVQFEPICLQLCQAWSNKGQSGRSLCGSNAFQDYFDDAKESRVKQV